MRGCFGAIPRLQNGRAYAGKHPSRFVFGRRGENLRTGCKMGWRQPLAARCQGRWQPWATCWSALPLPAQPGPPARATRRWAPAHFGRGLGAGAAWGTMPHGAHRRFVSWIRARKRTRPNRTVRSVRKWPGSGCTRTSAVRRPTRTTETDVGQADRKRLGSQSTRSGIPERRISRLKADVT